jgi:hypothetical protein
MSSLACQRLPRCLRYFRGGTSRQGLCTHHREGMPRVRALPLEVNGDANKTRPACVPGVFPAPLCMDVLVVSCKSVGGESTWPGRRQAVPSRVIYASARQARTLVTFAASASLPASTSGLLESPPSGSLRECRGTTLALLSLKERGKRPLDATSP